MLDRWLGPEIGLLDRYHRIGVRILADRPDLDLLQASGYREKTSLGVLRRVCEPNQLRNEAALARCLGPWLSV